MSLLATVLDVLALACLLGGALLCLTAGLGLLRFPDVLSRMHAGSKPQVLGVLLVMIGGGIRLHGWSATWMLLLVAAFQLLTTPVSAHLISRVAHRRRHVRRDLLLVDELAAVGGREFGAAGRRELGPAAGSATPSSQPSSPSPFPSAGPG